MKNKKHLHQKIDKLMLEQMKNLFEIQKVQCDLLEQLQKKEIIPSTRTETSRRYKP